MEEKIWSELLNEAINILDSTGIKRNEWTFGGGTALMFYYNHRLSFDIDIFLQDIYSLGMTF